MLEVARRRPLPQADFQVAFQQADAQCDALGEAAFDAAYSRFGVMFFSDPVAAFANIRLALKTGGRLSFVCWRPLEQNEWMKVPLEAALPFLPSAQMPPDLGAPGPFAFAERSRISNVLTEAGFDTVSIAAYDTAIGGDFEQAVRLALRVGPLGAALREHPACEAGVTDAVRSSLTRHVRQGVVMMRASVWIVRAESRQARSD
jgi:SAM-dependent methyltransferase